MFGQYPIIGNEKVIVDSKRKMKLPYFTGAEEKDRLAIFRSKNSYILINVMKFYELIKYCRLSKYNISYYSENKDAIQKLRNSFINVVRCDEELKIVLPREINDVKFNCIGKGKYLLLKRINKGLYEPK